MSPEEDQLTREYLGFPRVSGDEPTNEDVANAINSFSPRERG